MIFSLILALATTANAYTIKTTENGEQIRWEDQVVHYQINPGGSRIPQWAERQ